METVRIASMLSGLADTARWTRVLKSLVSIFGLKDIQEHFRSEEGPDGKWPPLNKKYDQWRRKKGKTKMLQFTGRLRQSFVMSVSGPPLISTIVNPVEYADKHDSGDGVPRRQFMWLSRKSMDFIERGLVDQIIGGSFGSLK